MAELERSNTDDLVMLAEIVPFGEQLDDVCPSDPWNFSTLPIPGIESLLNSLAMPWSSSWRLIAAKSEFGGHFERQAGALRVRALVELNDKLTDLGSEKGAARLALGEHQPVHLRVVVDGGIEIGCLERGVADSACLDHDDLPLVVASRPAAGARAGGNTPESLRFPRSCPVGDFNDPA